MKAIAILTSLLIVAASLLSTVAKGESYGITDSEYRLLPRYCQFLRGDGRVKPPRNMPEAHHFCHGLKFTVRANSGGGNKSFNLSSAVSEFDYVLSHTKDKKRYAKYLSLVSLHKAKILKSLGRVPEALALFQQSLSYNRSSISAYIGLGDMYRDIGMIAEAKEILKQGLKVSPKSKSLKRRLEKLN